MELRRRYYTLAEAAEVAAVSVRDIEHYIETGQLVPRLYTAERPFLVLSWDADRKQWDAHGRCRYQGLLSVHKRWVESLWVQGEVILNNPVTPVEPEHIQQYVTAYPFKSAYPNLPYTSWRPQEHDQLKLAELRLLPMPVEKKSLRAQLQPMMKVLNGVAEKAAIVRGSSYQRTDVEGQGFSDQQKYVYDFESNGLFLRAGLRLDNQAVSELQQDSVVMPPSDSEVFEGDMSRDENALLWSDSKKGGTRINEVFERLYLSKPGQPAKTYWRILRGDYGIFDPDKIIEQVTSGEVHWFTSADKSKVMKYRTFENRISELNRFYNRS